MSTLGENIAALRKKNEMTQEALASAIGISAQSVSKWENNTNMPDVLLLPVIADIFEVSIDTLFGRTERKKHMEANEPFDMCCEAIMDTIGADMYITTTMNLSPLAEIPYADEEDYIARYKAGLKYAYEGKLRTGIFTKENIVYYRHKIGGLLLKKPEYSWAGLFDDESAEKILQLIADRDFRTVMAEIIRSGKDVFTIASVCGKLGISDTDALEEKLVRSDMFMVKKVEIDEKEVSVYEWNNYHHMFLLFAIMICAKEFDEYQGMYYGHSGTSDYIYG